MVLNLIFDVTCSNKAQHQQRRFSLTVSYSLHNISTIPTFDHELNSAVQPKDYN